MQSSCGIDVGPRVPGPVLAVSLPRCAVLGATFMCSNFGVGQLVDGGDLIHRGHFSRRSAREVPINRGDDVPMGSVGTAWLRDSVSPPRTASLTLTSCLVVAILVADHALFLCSSHLVDGLGFRATIYFHGVPTRCRSVWPLDHGIDRSRVYEHSFSWRGCKVYEGRCGAGPSSHPMRFST
jgi:hypothetical protein